MKGKKHLIQGAISQRKVASKSIIIENIIEQIIISLRKDARYFIRPNSTP